MSILNVQITDTLDTLRTTFNSLSTNVGDISSLTTSSTNVVGAINEIKAVEVTLTGIQTLTNKTLTLPVISSISNSGTLTLPTGTDTLVSRTSSDTLTNKTYDTAGTGNSFKINGNIINAVTGTGSTAVLSTLPIFSSSGIKLSGSYNGTTTITASSTASGTITLPAVTGTVITSADTGTVTGTMLKNVVTLQILDSTGTPLKTLYGAGA